MSEPRCTCDAAFVRLMGYHGEVCPLHEAVGSTAYYEGLKRDALAGKLFQGGTIAWLVQRIEVLEEELADVHALDEWAACETACAERFEWTTGKVIGSKAPQWRVVMRGITLRPVRDFVAGSPPAARRAAVECLKKEGKDGS